MTDAFIALARPKKTHRFTAWLTIAVLWGATALSFGLFVPLGFAPLAGTDNVGRALGLALVILCTWIAVMLMPRSGALRLRIDADGIDWRGRPGRRRVRWDEVERIGDRPLMGMVKMAGDMTGATEGPTTVWLMPASQRGLNAAGNRALGYGDINISMIGTDRSRSDLHAALRQFAPAGALEPADGDTGMPRS